MCSEGYGSWVCHTTHMCEAMVGGVDDQWNTVQHVCSFKLLAKSITGEEVAQHIVSIVSQQLGIQSPLVIAVSRDRASVNELAMRTVKAAGV